MESEKMNASTSVLGETEDQVPDLPIVLRKRVIAGNAIQEHFNVNAITKEFIQKHYPKVCPQDWNDWRWQIRNSFTSVGQLSSFLNLSSEELAITEQDINLPIRITPYYASLLHSGNPLHPVRRTVVPVIAERMVSPAEESDPLGEHQHNKVKCIVHRYPDRVLFLVTDFCSVYCRYCTRSHMVAKNEKTHSSTADWDAAIEYIRQHPEVRDVLLSGGDPLTLSNNQLEYLLSRLRAIPHVEIIRIGTKVPVVLPQRITPSLVNLLKKFHPLFLSIHFTHPEELTLETRNACNLLADAGMPLGSQTVLLKGINDTSEVFKKLTHELLKVRVRPYYLYQCDPIPGSAHFRTPVKKGLEIIKQLRGHTSGYAIPHFVIDAPKGGGKIPLLPKYFIGKKDGDIELINYENKTYKYPDYI